MDAQRVSPLPWLSRRRRCARRIQRQIHVQPDGPARRFLRDFARAHSPDLPQFLSARKALAVHRHPARARRGMIPAPQPVSVLDLEPATSDFLAETIMGLSASPRTLPCKFFYDERGSDLFQRICDLAEYYVTRAELQILKEHRTEIAQQLGAGIELIGLGTGAGTKTRILLEELRDPIAYVPVDISREQLQQSGVLFRRLFPRLEILPVCA